MEEFKAHVENMAPEEMDKVRIANFKVQKVPGEMYKFILEH